MHKIAIPPCFFPATVEDRMLEQAVIALNQLIEVVVQLREQKEADSVERTPFA